MRVLFLVCGGSDDLPVNRSVLDDVRGLHGVDALEVLELPDVPTRRDLTPLDEAARAVLPVDPTPSLDEIAKRPDVDHLGTPERAPQEPEEVLRVVVCGTDAALSAVLTRLMRSDRMWVEVGYVPVDPGSPAAANFGLPSDPLDALALALGGHVHPAPLIRDDSAVAVAGSATVSCFDPAAEMTGEVIVDDDTLLNHRAGRRAPRTGRYGARLVPMLDAPGIAAVVADTPLEPVRGGFADRILRRARPSGTVDPTTLRTGRALQAGGPDLRITVDGVSRPRPAERVTFYRHLRDLQIVRQP
ncbi:hypothetical protein [Corynebacterium meridianum]|uniref:DAGKc domain-containing protein n=1 Tax=Corynebacterium meridianum TaxID=2765363 RepID=A0A934I109_9CORY|nr:hypothetical protein [Corynebacterium meridianum]MBI8990267.1 hypothetical protein [Corynebacterium meridianum]MCK7678379.1 hypothetical protein [Corynebacterium meridianum]